MLKVKEELYSEKPARAVLYDSYLTVNADEKGQTDVEQGAQFCSITALLSPASSPEPLISVELGVNLGT